MKSNRLLVASLFVQHNKQAADNKAAAANEARLMAEALATDAKVHIESGAEKTKQAAAQQIAHDLKKQQLVDEKNQHREEELCRKRKVLARG